jgi:gamma-glutamyltranspeptidase/glutathione hydrolase
MFGTPLHAAVTAMTRASRDALAAALVSTILLGAGACRRAPSARQEQAMNALPIPGRSVVATRYGIVASSQPLAAAAGVQMLEQGGNAVDAAIAANAALGVTEPMMNGVGGDLFAIVYLAKTEQLYGLNASGWAATGMDHDFLAAKGITTMPEFGVYSVTVPGAVAGWDALRARFGTLGFDRLLAPAIAYAEEGFPVAEVTAGLWQEAATDTGTDAAFTATYLVNGHAPRAGEIFRNPDLAATLRRIAQQGRDGFYRGSTAEAIVSLLHAKGGTMTAQDLAEFQPEWVTPLHTTYRGWAVYELPPNGQGIAALEMLNIMSRFPLASYGFQSAKAFHVMIEAKKLAYADLLRYVGDPKFSRIPVDEILSAENAEARAKAIDQSRARCRVEPARFASLERGGSETIYLTAIDRDGNIVSLIQSNYDLFGSRLVPAHAGFVLQNRGALFTLERDQPNTLAPRKRPLHTIIPGFIAKGEVAIGFGIMGGWNQSQAHAQFVSDVADFGLTIQQALEAGRFTKKTFDGCDVEVESRVPEETIAALRALGHEVQLRGPRTSHFGFGQAVMSDGTGAHFGASDPRHDGAAIPQPPPGPTPLRRR